MFRGETSAGTFHGYLTAWGSIPLSDGRKYGFAETNTSRLSTLTVMLSTRLGTLPLGTIALGAVAGVIFAATVVADDQPVAHTEATAVEPTTTVTPEVITVADAPVEPETSEPEIIEPEPFDYGECPPQARACVDLDGGRSWLQDNGQVTYGAVPIGQGGPGYETPRAGFHVSRKVIDDVSYVFDLAPMPFAVYFTSVGHAFHEGDPAGDSHGCVRLAPGDAEVYFHTLQVGDLIHIY